MMEMDDGRPAPVKHTSAPAWNSPGRAQRSHRNRFGVKVGRSNFINSSIESLNAHSEYSNSEGSGSVQHHINQYTIKEEIGRGSCGSVHIAIDQYGQKYAIKEFSKSRLRKRAQSNLLRRPNRHGPKHHVFANAAGSPIHPHKTPWDPATKTISPLDLIKEEIAIMKKLHHVNLVSLLEVLDDPDDDSLYMVMDYCKKGVVMKLGIGEPADAYGEATCRLWFRQMILGIEYLHMQGILHRDIKPDNCLVTDDDMLKITDFGVSEMFEKGQDKTDKSAGSPAFMPPELCVAQHGEISGRAADIWSMGATLYCLRFGRIPFQKEVLLELYDSIRNDKLMLDNSNVEESFKDLIYKLLEKDPKKRITMDDLREHPWVTENGANPLVSKDENIAYKIEPPTDAEVNAAITSNMKHLLVVVKAVKRFKELLFRKHPERREGILGRASRFVQPPKSMRPYKMFKSKSLDTDERERIESHMAAQGVHRSVEDREMPDQHTDEPSSAHIISTSYPSSASHTQAFNQPPDNGNTHSTLPPQVSNDDSYNGSRSDGQAQYSNQRQIPSEEPSKESGDCEVETGGKGQAHNPLLDHLFLNIGNGPGSSPSHLEATGTHVVCESPGLVDINVYETAYREEVEKILQREGRQETLFLTRRVEGNERIREMEGVVKWEEGAVKGYAAGEEEGGGDGKEGANLSVKAKLQGAIGKIAS